jgi:NitT/TauT family transport system permease protein
MTPHSMPSRHPVDSASGRTGADEERGALGVRGRPGARHSWREPRLVVASAACLVLGAAAWDLARTLGVLPAKQTASAEAIAWAGASGLADGGMLGPLGQTVLTFLCGLAASVLIGLPAGLAMGYWRIADESLGLTADALRPIPAVALVPVAVVVLGLGLRMQVALIVFAAVWPIVFNARYGARNVDSVMIDAARLSGLSRWATLRRVVLPASLPSVMTGIRLAAGVAVVLTVVTEIVASGTGIGNYVTSREQIGDAEHALAGVLLAALLGAAVNGLVRLIESRVIGWHHARQGASR